MFKKFLVLAAMGSLIMAVLNLIREPEEQFVLEEQLAEQLEALRAELLTR